MYAFSMAVNDEQLRSYLYYYSQKHVNLNEPYDLHECLESCFKSAPQYTDHSYSKVSA